MLGLLECKLHLDFYSQFKFLSKSQLGWCPVFKAASSNVFAHFCHDYFDDETCKNKRVKEKGFKGGFRELDDFIEKVEQFGAVLRVVI